MKQSIYWVMALAAGLVVANNYYNQPLLVDFAHTFRATDGQAGAVSIAAQAGYTLALLLFIPLGDKVELHKLFALTFAALYDDPLCGWGDRRGAWQLCVERMALAGCVRRWAPLY